MKMHAVRFWLIVLTLPATLACAGTSGQGGRGGTLASGNGATIANPYTITGYAPACASPSNERSNLRRANVRWNGTDKRTIRVRINTGENLKGWSEVDREQAVAALKDWESTGIPLHFEIVPMDSTADLTVCWVDRFAAPYGGWTALQWDSHGWIYAASISVALRDAEGNALSAASRAAIVVHEAGHAIGLPHSSDPTSIMWPVVGEESRMSAVDSVAARRLYSREVATISR